MKEIIEKSWNNVITNYFMKALIAYKRQLQGYFFLELNKNLPEHVIWIEPMIFLQKEYNPTKRPKMDGRIPDMVITRGKVIEAVIELKCKPWDSVQYQADLKKLKHFENLSSTNTQIPLSCPPISSNWDKQLVDNNKGEIYYKFKSNLILVFAAIAKEGSLVLSDLEHDIGNFLQLTTSIEHSNVK